MKFLHTADWQLGMKAVHLRDKAEAARSARFQAARRILEIARTAKVDFLILAGDTFEHHGIARAKVREVASMLAQASCPVYILPGNHDPASPGSVWEDGCWAAAKSVFLLLRNQPVEIPGGTLYPCPALTRTSVADPTAWIPPSSGSGYRIGVAHGAVRGHVEMEPCYPIPADAAARLQLDYLALGHNHSTATYDGGSGVVRMAYSGTHEPTKFGERNSGNVLLVDIDAPGAAPRIDTIPSHVLDWQTLDRSIRCAADIAAVAAELDALSDPEHLLVRCVLKGEAAMQDDDLERVAETIDSRFLFGELDREGLEINTGGDAWVEDLPAGYLRSTGALLRGRAAHNATEAAALAELRHLWREVRP